MNDRVVQTETDRAARRQLEQACAELERRLTAGVDYSARQILLDIPELARHKELALELIYTECVIRQELGQSVSPTVWLDQFPQWRGDLAELFQIHDLLGEDLQSVTPVSGDTKHVDHAAPVPNRRGHRIGQYKILREISRGGMGVVYQAKQLGLDRIVALKMILSPHAGLRERARFRTEAEAAARLQHPNIVQIHEVGEHDGCLYLSMEFVDGSCLDKKVAESPPSARATAELLKVLAQAVHFAHQRGIIHRDLKPANVLVTLDGVPKITDFGLAKRSMPADETGETGSGSDLTHAGLILGTPSYMAPEQASGKPQEIDARTDVYALGAVLYEIITGRAPFRGETPLHTLELVRTQEPVPPSRLQPRLPRDLETICLKSLEKDPDRRYQSAEDLANDLDRFLNGEAIRARSVSSWERAIKWSKRRPAAAALIFAVALGFAGVIWQWARAEASRASAVTAAREAERARQAERLHLAQAERDRIRANDERNRAISEQRRAEINFQEARRAVERLTSVGEQLIGRPHMETIGHAILEEALAFHQSLLQQKSNDPNIRLDTARAFMSAGTIQSRLGQRERSEDSYRQAVELLTQLFREFPTQDNYRFELARAQLNLGHVLRDAGRPRQAEETYRMMIDHMHHLHRASPDNVQYRLILANGLVNWTTVGGGASEGPRIWRNQGDDQLNARIRNDRGAIGELARDAAVSQIAAGANSTTGFHFDGVDDQAVVGDRLDMGVSDFTLEVRIKGDPTMQAWGRILDKGHYSGYSFGRRGNTRKVGFEFINSGGQGNLFSTVSDVIDNTWHHVAVVKQGTVVRIYADGVEENWQVVSSASQQNTLPLLIGYNPGEGTRGHWKGELDEIRIWGLARTAEQIQSAMRQTVRGDEEGLLAYWRADSFDGTTAIDQTSNGHNAQLLSEDWRDEAENALSLAIELQKGLLASQPDHLWARDGLALSLENLGGVMWRNQNFSRAEALYREALSIRQQIVAATAEPGRYHFSLSLLYHSLAAAEESMGRPAEAVEHLREAIRLVEPLVARFPRFVLYQETLSRQYADVARVLESMGQAADAMKDHECRIALLEKLLTDHSREPRYRRELIQTQLAIARLCEKENQPIKATECYLHALTHAERFATEFADEPNSRTQLTRSLRVIVNRLQTGGQSSTVERALLQLIERHGQLAAENPDQPEHFQRKAADLQRLGFFYKRMGRQADTEKAYREAVSVLDHLAAQIPKDYAVRNDLAGALTNLGNYLKDAKRLSEAESVHRQALGMRETLVAEFPTEPSGRAGLAHSYSSLGELFERMGRIQETIEYLRNSIAHHEKLVADFSDQPFYRKDLARAYRRLGFSLKPVGPDREIADAFRSSLDFDGELAANAYAWFLLTCADEQLRDPEFALRLAKKAVESDPREPNRRNTLALAYYRCADWHTAAVEIRHAIDLRTERRAKPHGADWIVLAMAHWRLGEFERARDCYAKAEHWMAGNQNNSNLPEVVRLCNEAETLMASYGGRETSATGSP